MLSYALTVLAALVAAHARGAEAGSGSVELDEFTFDKLVTKFPAALVKFDVAFPYGDKHDAYTALARDAREVEELLVAEVGVKDYGEKENEALAKKYGASKDNYPVIKLFLRGKSEPLTFDGEGGFTADALRLFVREKTGLYLSLPGCVRGLDSLALKFLGAPEDERRRLLTKVEGVEKDLTEKDLPSAKIYKLIMQRVLEKGDGFIDTEFQRVKKLQAGKISDEKKKELSTRLNILQTFRVQSQGKDEL